MIPREELEELLGLDIPPTPEISLAGITNDSVLLYWKPPPDIQSAPLSLSIQVNGIKGKPLAVRLYSHSHKMLTCHVKVGEFTKGDTSIQITGLVPGNYYGIRVLATNSANFTTIGPLIRLRTIPLPSNGEDGTSSSRDSNTQSEPAAVHTAASPFDIALPGLPSKDTDVTHHQGKRIISGRRNSPAMLNEGQAIVQSARSGGSDEDESPEAIQRLTERLNFLRAEKERVDREIAEEEEEAKRNIAEMTKERDRARQELREKEEASAELRRHGNQLDKLNRAAQSRKAAKEKQLQQKKAERQKVKDDNARWEREIIEMRQNVKRRDAESAAIIAEKDRNVAEMRKGIDKDLAEIKSLEEDIRVIGAQIKVLEREQERLMSNGSDDQEQTRAQREAEQAWEARMQVIQTQLSSWSQTLQQTQLEQQQAEEHLAWWMAKRARNPEQFAPIPSFDQVTLTQRTRSRRGGQPNSRTSTISSPSTGFPSGSAVFHNASSVSPPFSTASPFFNMGNGTSVPPLPERLGLQQSAAENLISSGPMSPAASNLLPSNLFRDEDMTIQRLPKANDQDSVSHSGVTEAMLGHAVTNSDASIRGLHTPGSTSSRPGSILPSPQEISQQLQGHQARPDPFTEGDQPPLNSTTSPFSPSVATDNNPLVTNRLANLFSNTFTRQRGKSGSQEPPMLGTLKQGQSQSFPRNLEQDVLDSDGNRRRRGSHGNWANPMSGLLNRNADTPEGSGLITARTGSGRRSRLNMFAPKVEGSEPSGFADNHSSSRPSSTYSYDQALARPSSDSQRFGWSLAESVPNRSSPLSTQPQWGSGPWSRVPSRRPSVQHGSTSNLSIGSTPLDPDGFPGSISKQSSEQAPIGTRPQSSRRPITPKLNPAAPTFKTLFTRGEAKKSAKADKPGYRLAEKSKERDGEKCEIDDIESNYESSPQGHRLSRDAQSITTAASTADSHESFDRSTSGTPSDAVTTPGPKETLMQKITRKSSSSKFNVPWSKERLFAKRAGEPSTPGEIEGDASSESQLGKSAESSSSTPQEKAGRSSLSWPNIRRKSKKGDQMLTEATEPNSENGDDEDA